MIKRWISVLLVVITVVTLTSCAPNDDGYYRQKWDNPLKDEDVGGSDRLCLAQTESELTLENAHIRVIFSKKNGAIKELVNKDAKVYLTKEGDAPPLRINLIKNGTETTLSQYTDFAYETTDGETKEILFSWTIADILIKATVSLTEDATELIFRLDYEGNRLELAQDGTPIAGLYNVEYPIINNIGRLYSAERDHLLTPFVTGYIIDDPVGNFNDSFAGIGKSLGMYPSGWEYPMQFQSYYSDGIGGFMFSTRDGGDGIKSFTFTGSDEKLRTSIYHYLDDISVETGGFDYDIVIGNLTEGSWYESADMYRQWAKNQSWCTEKGQLSERDDLNWTLLYDTAMCNFDFPFTATYGREEQEALYLLQKENLQGGSILNVGFSGKTDRLNEIAKENDDLYVFFEFPSFHRVSDAMQEPTQWETMIKSFRSNDESVYYTVGTTRYFYDCAACSEYRQRFLQLEQSYLDDYGVNGFYHDVGVAAVHPKQCFDTTHEHGTRVNVITDYLEQMKELSDLAHSVGGIYGQELIFEQMLPYVDFYQARANAELLGWMENDRLRDLIDQGVCHKVSLFDYVYSAYGAMRLDGFLSADPALGKGYYYVAAYTFVNGGIVEYNYEFYNADTYLTSAEMDTERLAYLGKLYEAKKTFARDYLVYGEMVKTPVLGNGKTTYLYLQDRFGGDQAIEGKATFDDVVACAYRLDNTIGLLMANTTEKTVTLKFAIDAQADWNIDNGTIYLVTTDGETQIGTITSGEAKIDVVLQPYQVALIRIA